MNGFLFCLGNTWFYKVGPPVRFIQTMIFGKKSQAAVSQSPLIYSHPTATALKGVSDFLVGSQLPRRAPRLLCNPPSTCTLLYSPFHRGLCPAPEPVLGKAAGGPWPPQCGYRSGTCREREPCALAWGQKTNPQPQFLRGVLRGVSKKALGVGINRDLSRSGPRGGN